MCIFCTSSVNMYQFYENTKCVSISVALDIKIQWERNMNCVVLYMGQPSFLIATFQHSSQNEGKSYSGFLPGSHTASRHPIAPDRFFCSAHSKTSSTTQMGALSTRYLWVQKSSNYREIANINQG